jgi:hypothetical protein
LSIGFGHTRQRLRIVETNQQLTGEHVVVGFDEHVGNTSRHCRTDLDLTRSRLDSAESHRFPRALGSRRG